MEGKRVLGMSSSNPLTQHMYIQS